MSQPWRPGVAVAYDPTLSLPRVIRKQDVGSSMRSLLGLAVGLTSVLACGGGGQHPVAKDSGLASAPATERGAPAATPNPPPPSMAACPANGRWSECAVFQALDRAGLAPRRDSASGAITLPPLAQSGTRLLLGGSELDIFVYPDVGDRERDEGRLDRSKYIEASDEPTLRGEATLIRTVNLLAVLRSRNDHQRERVSDALSAGPPQARGTASLPSTHVPR